LYNRNVKAERIWIEFCTLNLQCIAEAIIRFRSKMLLFSGVINCWMYEMLFRFGQIWHFYCTMFKGLLFFWTQCKPFVLDPLYLLGSGTLFNGGMRYLVASSICMVCFSWTMKVRWRTVWQQRALPTARRAPNNSRSFTSTCKTLSYLVALQLLAGI